MYHEEYHPVSAKTLQFLLDNKGWTAEDKRIIVEKVQAAADKKIRDFEIILDTNKWVKIENGLIKASSMSG